MKIFVGLSGGVDSAVSAYLLKKAGHDVTGVFLKVWEPDFLPCTSGEDKLDAMRVAAHLEIPFLSYDLAEEYKKGVVDYFVSEYKAGRTPNPDVMCNREVKFGAFWERAKKDGADAIATGHYVSKEEEGGKWKMVQGVDKRKDQSYFLWTLTQDDLAHALFPVGDLEKKEVRKIAEEVGLPNFEKKDSQGLCFLGHVDMKEFLKHFIPVNQGVVKNDKGEEIGTHDGVQFYTLGEGFPLEGGKKMYVVKKDVEKNELFISEEEHEPTGKKTLTLHDINWIREVPQKNETYFVHIRYHGDNLEATVENNLLVFKKPVLAASGQSAVVYRYDTRECMGGGIID